MPKYPESGARSSCVAEAGAPHAKSSAQKDWQEMDLSSGGDRHCVICEVRKSLPMVLGNARCYYVSHQGGSRMLVLERRQGERIRINGTTEVVVLEIHADHVKIAIESWPDDATKSHG